MRRHRHDGPRAIARQHVVRDPDGNLLGVDRIDGIRAREHAGFLLREFRAFEIGFAGGEFLIILHRRFLFRRGDLRHQLVLRRKHHVGRAEQRVWPRGEHADGFARTGHRKIHFRALAAPDPIPLHLLERIAPVDGVQVRKQFLREGGDAQHPLAHRLADDGEAADLALAVNDLLVRQHGAEFRAPVHGRFAHVGETLGIPERPLLFRRGAVRRQFQRCHRLRLVRFRVEPRIVQLEKNPLRPLEILHVRGGDFTGPIVAEAEALDLAREVFDVRLGRHARMLAGLHGVLLGGQAEGVPTHGMQHIETGRPAIARQNVRGGVALRMPDVQPRAAGVGEHVENIKLRRQLRGRRRAGHAMARGKGVRRRNGLAWIEGAERLLLVPGLLPLGLDEMKRILSAAARHRAC